MTELNEKDIRLESSLLKALSVRDNYETFAHLIDTKRLLPNSALLIADYDKYFASFSDDSEINWETFTTEFTQHWHRRDLDEYDIEYYRDTVIPMLVKLEQKDANSVLVGLLDREYADKITSAINSHIDKHQLQQLIDDYEKARSNYVQEVDDDAGTIDSIDFTMLDKQNGIPWFLPAIQKGLGSLVQGQFVVIAADYGVGKSAFGISQAAETFKYLHKHNLDSPILYFNSEGTQADVYTRFLSCLYRNHIEAGFEDVLARIDEVKEKFTNTFNANNLLVFQIQQNDMSKIKQKIEHYKPCLVIIDIADVLAPEEDVQNLKKLFDGLRLLSAKSCPILATTQSGDTSYKYFDKEKSEMIVGSRKWLTEKDLYGSKSGKGGAADTIITIGKDDDMPNIRYVHTPKLKRGRVVKATCEIIDRFSYYKEIL